MGINFSYSNANEIDSNMVKGNTHHLFKISTGFMSYLEEMMPPPLSFSLM